MSKRRDENRIGETVTELFGNEDLDAQTALKLEALAALHERKVELMKSISAQKEELAKLKAASREHRRSQLIQDLRNQELREQSSRSMS